MGSAPSTSAICIPKMFRSECSFEQSCHSLSFDFFFFFFPWGGGGGGGGGLKFDFSFFFSLP